MKGWLLLLLLNTSWLLAVSPWYSEKNRGWYYFEENKQETTGDLDPEIKEISLENASKIIEEQKIKSEKLLSLALINPTVENVSNYLKHHKQLIDQAARFASTWKSALLLHPEHTFDLPKTDYATLLMKAQDEKAREERLDLIKKKNFILFIFQGKDFLSQELGSILSNLSQRKGWKIEAISANGLPLESYPNAQINQGLIETIGAKVTPSIYLVDPIDNYILPLGTGLMDQETIEKNIDFQLLRRGDSKHAL